MQDEIQEFLERLRPALFLAGLAFIVALVASTTVAAARDRERLLRQFEQPARDTFQRPRDLPAEKGGARCRS